MEKKTGKRAKGPTVRSVAERAGVSKSLVSLVMNGSKQVSEKRRDEVLKAARELGYRPNALARSLVSGRTNTVGVVISNVANPWWVALERGLSEELDRHGVRALLADPRMDPEVADGLVEAFLELRVDGMVFLGTQPVEEVARNASRVVPTVLTSFSRPIELPNVDCVNVDDEKGIALVLEHLCALGHRRIAYVDGSDRLVTSDNARLAAYLSQMERLGLSAEIRTDISDVPLNEDVGYDAARRLLGAEVPPTAIVAGSDLGALGILAAADDLGARVPQDLSVTGFDNTRLSSIRHVSLTTVDPNGREMGRLVAQCLAGRIESPDRPRRDELVEPSLVVRATTGPAPGR
ncbi:LacI family DNA-binding transcriptional regulator [Poseidonocella sp. HB161398]|uniref:LacI family DNA-binding transcriptional regulator n=1 Tax=Poseidonocella sp. HB161398 TaxID=2320855 RepID=UPI0011094BC5|nr:LacI family DNA-binding transcriptional regulator [Poseidonocella sp. HB161398]